MGQLKEKGRSGDRLWNISISLIKTMILQTEDSLICMQITNPTAYASK